MVENDLFGPVPLPGATPGRSGKPAVRPQFSWFFALRPTTKDAQDIHSAAGALLAASGVGGTRITPDRLHITLEWIGDDLDDDALDRGCRAADTIKHPALDASFNALRTFPAPSGPCVLLGTEGLDAVRQLRSELVHALADHGFKPPRTYEPHMTLCYDRVHRLAQTPITPVTFHATEFVLVKSYLGLSHHEVIRSWRLGG